MFGQTPEVLEKELHESLVSRTLSLPSFRSLGPPDLVELQKSTKNKVSSTYHFVTGIDVSSAAAIAAYMTTLTGDLGENQLWFERAPMWRVSEGTYCCWNVFSKVDVRVTAAFPGTTKMYIVTIDGLVEDEALQSEAFWWEVHMSAMMRCLLFKDSDSYLMEYTRHEFPFDAEGVKLFFRTFEKLYFKAPLVGAGPWVQNASTDCNYMVDALYRLLEVTGEYAAAIEMLGRIEAKEVLVRVLLQGNQEVNAVSLLVNTVRKEPRNARMLASEAEFCLSKSKLDLALDCAKRAVAASPSDFYPWEVLCRVYVAREQWDQALLALNSTPLIPIVPMDVQRLPAGKKVHCPLPNDGVLAEAWQTTADKSNPVTAQAMSIDPALARLPGSQLRGSTERAYSLLATINAKIGWNELMRLRGEVFWMEAESQSGHDSAENLRESCPEKESNPGQESGQGDGVSERADSKPARRTLRSKRLCERRIDRLFLVLFEDVHAYSAWQREALHFESQKLPFDKSALEWEVFGTLAQRLKHKEQAKRAFAKSLAMYFSHRALAKELEFDEYSITKVVKLLAWNHRWYNEFSPKLMGYLRKIVARDGLTKVGYEVEAIFGKESVVDLVKINLNRLKAIRVAGWDL